MMNELVSIIIPVYNTEKYIDECIKSVVKQTYQNLEIILVDDGATDESPELCNQWKKKDTRIIVIHKNNEGLGYTRNRGLTVAKGKYVSFFDSDDMLALNTIEECVKQLEEYKADACFYGRYTQGADGIYRVNREKPKKLVFSNNEILEQFTAYYLGSLPNDDCCSYIQPSACCGMYRRNLIEEHRIRFFSERDVLSEDTFFNLEVCRYSEKILILPYDFYYYRYNGNSLTKKYNPNRLVQLKGYFKKMEEYLDTGIYSNLNQLDLRISNMKYIYFRQSIEYEIKAQKEKGFWNVVGAVQALCRDQELTGLFRNFPYNKFGMKAKIFVYLFLHNCSLGLVVYYWYKKI